MDKSKKVIDGETRSRIHPTGKAVKAPQGRRMPKRVIMNSESANVPQRAKKGKDKTVKKKCIFSTLLAFLIAKILTHLSCGGIQIAEMAGDARNVKIQPQHVKAQENHAQTGPKEKRK
jgi:hypothetical protein